MSTTAAGLALERTALSWRRTFLSVCVLAVLVIGHGASTLGPVAVVVGAGAAVLAAALCLPRTRHRPDGRAPAGLALLLLVASLIVLVSAL